MKWILIGLIAGSLIVSEHTSEEQCEGRRAMVMKEKATNAKCHTVSELLGTNDGSFILWDGSSER